MMSWLPPGVSTYSGQIDSLFYLIYYVTTATFFAVQITLLVFVFRYRYDPNRRATYTHGNTTLEIAWTVAPALMLAALAIMSRTTWADIKWRQPPSDFNVIVTAKQFNWEIAYPGPDGYRDTDARAVRQRADAAANRFHLHRPGRRHDVFDRQSFRQDSGCHRRGQWH